MATLCTWPDTWGSIQKRSKRHRILPWKRSLFLDAVKATLERAGLTMDDLVSVTVYCTDLKLYDSFNTVYKGYFHGNYPARVICQLARQQLLRGVHFEVQGIATKGH